MGYKINSSLDIRNYAQNNKSAPTYTFFKAINQPHSPDIIIGSHYYKNKNKIIANFTMWKTYKPILMPALQLLGYNDRQNNTLFSDMDECFRKNEQPRIKLLKNVSIQRHGNWKPINGSKIHGENSGDFIVILDPSTIPSRPVFIRVDYFLNLSIFRYIYFLSIQFYFIFFIIIIIFIINFSYFFLYFLFFYFLHIIIN